MKLGFIAFVLQMSIQTLSTNSQFVAPAARPTLEPLFSKLFIRPALSLPRSALRAAGGALRVLATSSLDSRFSHERVPNSLNLDLYETSYAASPQLRQEKEHVQLSDFIFYLHGGAFALCDSGDVLLGARGLLPLLNAEDKQDVTCCSLLYTLSKSSGEGHFPSVCSEVVAAYDLLCSSRGRCLAIIGDSAGGNAALALVQMLTARGTEKSPPLVLISPWLDLFANHAAETSQRDYIDMLDASWLERSRTQYLGAGVASLTDVGLSFDQRGQPVSAAELAAKFASLTVDAGFRVVAFDMDQCMVAAHSRGRLRRSQLGAFTSKLTRDFVLLAAACADAGLLLAVATHSDEKEYGLLRPQTHYIVGEDLVRAVLHAAGLSESAFFIQAYNPAVRGTSRDAAMQNKKRHIRNIASHYAVDPSACLLLDDDEGNVSNTDGAFSAIRVDAATGLRAGPALLSLARLAQARSSRPPPGRCINEAAQGLVSPAHMTDEALARLPDLLLIAGDRELLYDEICRFHERLTGASAAGLRPSARTEFHVGSGDIHAYPLHHTHPVRLGLRAFRCGWLFDLMYPGRAETNRTTNGYDSQQAHDALLAMATFLSPPSAK